MTTHPSGWTTSKPSVEGWYWWKNDVLRFAEQVCYVKTYKGQLWGAFMDRRKFPVLIMGGEFLGPLTPEQYIEWAQRKKETT